jgi:hypothetical protein
MIFPLTPKLNSLVRCNKYSTTCLLVSQAKATGEFSPDMTVEEILVLFFHALLNFLWSTLILTKFLKFALLQTVLD